ncbi:hypothetical protein CPB86DRAFT_779791, partial [Serendipita vermifera]
MMILAVLALLAMELGLIGVVHLSVYSMYLLVYPVYPLMVHNVGCTIATLIGTFSFFYPQIFPFKSFWDPNSSVRYRISQDEAIGGLGAPVLRSFWGFWSRKRVSTLPPEIWEMILAHVIEMPVVFETTCQSRDFYQHIRSLLGDRGNFHNYELYSERERKKLRLVCKLWAGLMDRQSMRWVFHDVGWKSTGRGLKRLDMQIGSQSMSLEYGDEFFPVFKPSLKRLDSILPTAKNGPSLTTACLNILNIDPTEDTIRAALERVQDVPSIRAFSYVSQHGSANFLLPKIQDQFASLTSLCIEAIEVRGSLYLARLEVLYLNVVERDSANWRLPSLLHCGIGPSIHTTDSFTFAMIPGPRHQLLSLFFDTLRMPMVLDQKFWHEFPRLEILCTSSRWLSITQDVPFDHPISQLTFVDSPDHPQSLDLARVMLLVEKIPSIQRISVPVATKPPLRNRPVALVYMSLFLWLRNRGVKWVDLDGLPVIYDQIVIYREGTLSERNVCIFSLVVSLITVCCFFSIGKSPTLLAALQAIVFLLQWLLNAVLLTSRFYECYWSPTRASIRVSRL